MSRLLWYPAPIDLALAAVLERRIPLKSKDEPYAEFFPSPNSGWTANPEGVSLAILWTGDVATAHEGEQVSEKVFIFGRTLRVYSSRAGNMNAFGVFYESKPARASKAFRWKAARLNDAILQSHYLLV